jgi:hypothetical protein
MSTQTKRTVTGTFDGRDAVVDAIASLTEHSVPADAIEVMVIDSDGLHPRRVTARPTIGWWEGMRVGLLLGAVGGAACFALLASGTLPGSGIAQMLPDDILSATFVGALAGAGFLGPAAALLMLGRGRRRVQISPEEAKHNVVAVTVRGDKVADIAREVLAEAGAARVSG